MKSIMPATLGIFLLTGFLLLAGEPRLDQKAMQGTWAVLAYDMDGKAAPAEIVGKMTVEIKGDKLTIQPRILAKKVPVFKDGKVSSDIEFKVEAAKTEEVTFKLNVEKKPKRIDLSRHGETKTIPGIYEIEGDSLKICFSLTDQKRPKKIPETPKGGQVRLILKKAGTGK